MARLAGIWIEPQNLRAVDNVYRIAERHVVAADFAGAGLVARVIVELAEPGQLALPEQPAGVDVDRSEHVGPLDHQSPGGHLRRRAVAVSRQHLVVRRPAEPEDAQRRFHTRVVRHHAIGRVGIIVCPIGGPWQGAFAVE